MVKRIHLNTLLNTVIMMLFIRPLCVRLPQMSGYARKFNENAAMSFMANDKQLLKNCNQIWEKVEKLLKIEYESKPVYGDDSKYIKTKIKIYAGNMITNFQNILIIMLDSVNKANKKYYPQTLYYPQKCTRKDKDGKPY